MKKITILVLTLFGIVSILPAQMWNGVDTLYGNEWIDYDQSYYKITIAEDGIYKITKTALEAAGIPINNITGDEFQLFSMGVEIPLYVSTNNTFGGNDYIEFYGKKNRGELDQYLYRDPANEQLNPEYSLFSDKATYYLTWKDGNTSNARFQTIANDLANAPGAENFYQHETLLVFGDQFAKKVTSSSIGRSSFEQGEGFAKTLSNSHAITLNASEVNNSGGEAALEVRLTGDYHVHDLSIDFNGSTLTTEAFTGHLLKAYNFTFSTSVLSDDNTLDINGNAGTTDRLGVAYARLSYPRNFDFNNENRFAFQLKPSNGSVYLEIENFNNEGQDPILYDVTNQLRLVATVESGTIKAKLPASTTTRDLILVSTGTGIPPLDLDEVNFINFAQADAEFIIISHPALYSGGNFVQDYANYRSSTNGGSFSSIVIDIEDLYEQFAYGVERHSISIRNFGHYIKKNWTNPRYVFIIGKGRELVGSRTDAQLATTFNETFYVPTFGSPGSDNLLLAGLYTDVPVIPISRIAAANPEEIKIYLDKVETMEGNINNPQTIEDRHWMKRLIHLGGGGTNEQAIIKSHLLSMEQIIENNKFGGAVTGFYKSSTDPIQIGESDDIFDRINDGVSVITFFGHSAVGTFDFSIDNPDKYENYGKYPLTLSLGCYSGNIHTSSQGISERFIFLKDKGSIAFGASTGLGQISSLRAFAERYYSLMGGDSYGKGIGDILQETLRFFDSNQSLSYESLMQQFTLHGDPAFKLSPSLGPDYTVGVESVSFTPSVVTTQLDSFEINFDVSNLGYYVQDTMVILIEQELPNGERFALIEEKIPTPPFANSFAYKIPSYGKIAGGLNNFYIKIDINNDIDEFPAISAENNNELKNSNGTLGVPLFIFDDSARPVHPQNFGIVSESDVTLKASTSNALVLERKYLIEIDTTELFNSPFKQRKEIIQGGGVVKWQPNLNMVDSTVYYWRVSPDSINTELGFIWENSSFVYLPNSSDGWNQSHYFQYKKDEFLGLELDEDRRFTFGENGVVIRLINKLWDLSDRPAFLWNFGNPASSVRPWPYFDNGISIFVGDSITGSGWKNNGTLANGDYNSINGSSSSRVFSFPTTTEEGRADLINFLENVIQPNNYVVLFSVVKNFNSDFMPQDWAQDSIALGKNIFSVLEAQGATSIRSLEQTGSVPYTFIYRKDDGPMAEDIGETIYDKTVTEAFLPISRQDGYLTSDIIGPAKSWESVLWKIDEVDASGVDTNFVTIYGLDASGMETILVDQLSSKDTMLDFVDAGTYPYLRLGYSAIDLVNRTAPQLNYWRVLYEGLPDAAVSTNEHYVFNSDTLQQGEPLLFEIAIENVSNYNMDSLLVNFSVLDGKNNEILQQKRFKELPKDGLLEAKFDVDTRQLSGVNSLVMEVNPDKDQPELYQFNNFAIKQFLVESDRENPLLDVTFDGVHIMDGDIISPKPSIFISLKDENSFLELSDTSLFKIFIKYPQAALAENIPMESEWVKFYPADIGSSAAQNKASIELNPIFEEEGIYQLLIQAEDASGNQSGSVDFKVSFEVITQQSISNVLNYPNPFSTSTQFVYTLTGEEIPDYFKIQILTVSGKIVKEITQDEIGPLRVGTHRTDYRWDGTDTYGQRLANGTYLYRVVVKKANGEDYDKYQTGVSGFFKRDFGKLVILR